MSTHRTAPSSSRPSRTRRAAAAATSATALLAAALTGAAPASADYGKTAVYQIALSANLNGQYSQLLGGTGGGVWLWIELSSDGTGDYTGADCGHGDGGGGAASNTGGVHWTDTGGNLVITGIVLNGFGGVPATVTVPDTYGHYTGTLGSYITLPLPPFITSLGTSQLQVAP